MHTGYLYITPQYLVFDGAIHVFADRKAVIPILSIESLNKIKYIKIIPGKGSDVEIKLKDGEVHKTMVL